MDPVAVGWWGAFFGVAVLLGAGSLLPLANGLPRVAVITLVGPLLSSAYVLACLGWLPGSRGAHLRVLAGTTFVSCILMSALMLLMMRTPARIWRTWRLAAWVTALTLLASWALAPWPAVQLATGYAVVYSAGILVLLFSRSGLRDDRLIWLAIGGVTCILVALVAAWQVWSGAAAPWGVHAAASTAFIGYLACMAGAVWSRYSSLAELRQVLAHGPGYDPVTRMRSHADAGQLLGSVFGGQHPVGVLVITIANLAALESLHGRTAHNSALFVLAGRLRRTVPGGVQMGRLGPDGFLVLVRRPESTAYLNDLAAALRDRLVRPVNLSTGEQPPEVHVGLREWQAQAGIGVLLAPPGMRAALAVATARSMSRTALTYASRIAGLCSESSRIVETGARPAPADA